MKPVHAYNLIRRAGLLEHIKPRYVLRCPMFNPKYQNCDNYFERNTCHTNFIYTQMKSIKESFTPKSEMLKRVIFTLFARRFEFFIQKGWNWSSLVSLPCKLKIFYLPCRLNGWNSSPLFMFGYLLRTVDVELLSMRLFYRIKRFTEKMRARGWYNSF